MHAFHHLSVDLPVRRVSPPRQNICFFENFFGQAMFGSSSVAVRTWIVSFS